jgi:FkbM family methyltransferase
MRAFAKRLHPARLRRTFGAASCVRERTWFVARELRKAPSVGQYRLRESGLTALVRHPLLDMWVLEEIFRWRAYEPPAGAREALVALGRGLRVLDLGGHVGLFGLFVQGAMPVERLISFEPDPRNAELLRRCVAANRLGARWQVIEACAATRDGTIAFRSSYHLSRLATAAQPLVQLQHGIAHTFPFLTGTAILDSEEREVRCRDAYPFLLDADLVKMDIEGGEWELLADHRLSSVPARAIVLEYHYGGAPADPDRVVARALARAGYTLGAAAAGVDGAVIWGWKG